MEDNEKDYLLRCYISEYEMLTTRATYYITMQYSILPTVLIYIGLIAQVWNVINRGYLIWSSMLVIQSMALLWVITQRLMYDDIQYIEECLRPAIKSIVGVNTFLMHENFLDDKRGKSAKLPIAGEYFVPMIPLFVILGLAIHRFGLLSKWEYVGIALNLVVWGYIVKSVFENAKIRSAFVKTPISS